MFSKLWIQMEHKNAYTSYMIYKLNIVLIQFLVVSYWDEQDMFNIHCNQKIFRITKEISWEENLGEITLSDMTTSIKIHLSRWCGIHAGMAQTTEREEPN